MEIWERTDYAGYLVSSYGRIRGPNYTILKPYRTKGGYLRVCIRGKSFGVANLVATAFHGPCPDSKEVHHKDHDKQHNTPDNLAYVTRRENVYAYAALRGWQQTLPPQQGYVYPVLCDDVPERLQAALAWPVR